MTKKKKIYTGIQHYNVTAGKSAQHKNVLLVKIKLDS